MKTRQLILAGAAVVAIALLVADRTIWTRVGVSGKTVWRRAIDADSVPLSVAAAEAHGAHYPPSTEPLNYSPGYAADTYIGTSERQCVDADTANFVRSGDFIGGAFAHYAEYWATGYGKLSWMTGHTWPLKTPVTFELRVSRIDTAGYAFVYQSPRRTVRWRDPYASDALGAGAWIVLPSRGKWMFVATMDRSWGCVLFSL